MTDDVTPDGIMQTALGFWSAKTLLSAVELGLFTEIASSGPLDAESLRQRLGVHERSARDFFDALVAIGMLRRDEQGRYSNTPETDTFLDRNKTSYVGGMLEMANERLFPFWANLTRALRSGQPQNEAAGQGDFFEEIYSDPARLRLFVEAMSGVTAGTAKALAQKFPWDQYRTFADVGCAQGMVPVTLATEHPHLQGIGYDLPKVQPIFEEFAGRYGVADRVTFQPGDFFEHPLPQAEVLIKGLILHDWGLDEKKHLLSKAHDALPKGGILIVYDNVIDDARRENAFGLLMSLNMLIETPSGFDYTGAECQQWMKEAGFQKTRVEHLVGPTSMVIGVK